MIIKLEKKTLYILVNAISWLPLSVYIFVVIWPLVINPGNFMISKLLDSSIVAVAYNLSLFLLVYIIIESFRFYEDKVSKVWQELNRNSYGVYIIHVIVTGLITLLMRDTGIPSLVKFFILTITTFLGSNLIISIARALAGVMTIRKVEKPVQIVETLEAI